MTTKGAPDGTKLIHSRAPTRIDLAGGTIDIWPIYLFLDRPVTLNLAIDLYAETLIEAEPPPAARGPAGQVLLRSDDQNQEITIGWPELEKLTDQELLKRVEGKPGLILHLKLLRHFHRKIRGASHLGDLKLSTIAKSPAGAGLGGSSSLSVSLIGALQAWARSLGQVSDHEVSFDAMRGEAGLGTAIRYDEGERERSIDIVRDIETTVIRVPAGLQDYYGAMFGGLQSLRWLAGRHSRESLPGNILAGLEQRILLFYSGQSRNSGINNWALFKSFIDGDGAVRSQFAEIAASAGALESALRARDWEAAASAIAREWKVRRTIAAGISTPEMDRAFEKAASLGAPAGKVCGAGGGGCFFVFVPSGDEGLKARIVAEITGTPGSAVRALPFRAVPHGLVVTGVSGSA